MNGDGFLDVLLGGNGAHQVLVGDAGGTLTPVAGALGIVHPEAAPGSLCAAFADVNMDGLLDVYVGAAAPAADVLFVGIELADGSRAFAPADGAAGAFPTTTTSSCSFGDIDGDGDQDLLTVENAAPLSLFVNGGDGTFSEEAVSRGLGSMSATGAVLADITADGHLDAVLAAAGPSAAGFASMQAYINDGTEASPPPWRSCRPQAAHQALRALPSRTWTAT